MTNNISIGETQNSLDIRLLGSLDNKTAKQLEDAFKTKAQGKKIVTLYMEAVQVITADGARVLLNAYINSQQMGYTMHLVNPHPSAKELLDLIGLSSLLEEEAA